jgi:hypothetical protein
MTRRKALGLVAAVEESVAAMPWLRPSDGAAVALALSYAARIDAAVASGDEVEATKASYLGPHLMNALRQLGGTPADRKALGGEEVVGGKLAHLRAVDRA